MNTPKEIKCMQCRKEIKSITHECKLCIKSFHPSCAKLHKVINAKDQLVPCKGQIEVITISTDNKEEDQTKKCRRGDEAESARVIKHDKHEDLLNNRTEIMNKFSSVSEITKSMEKVMREEFKQLKQQLIVEVIDHQIKAVIKEIITEEVNKATQKLTDEIKYLKVKIEEMVKEKTSNDTKSNEKQTERGSISRSDKIKDSYAQTVRKSKKNEIIVQPVREQGSESTEGTIKHNVNIMQLGASVERIIKGPKGRITLECEKAKDSEILKEALIEKLGTQYKIYEPNKNLGI
ncbi:unnamed protein product [Lasius platythorax]|uniref:Phorbol-ester/DAG-type domain-containing protein n=1 Tax=Lasius platythorax TaxID=488582 RepID=A0AAV2N008_9HYME